MKYWNIILLFTLAIAANGNVVREIDLNESKALVEVTTKQVAGAFKKHRKRKSVGSFKMQKPRIVLTLMSTKQIIPINESDLNRIEPFRFDPFQRFLQLFFSSFLRDLSQPSPMMDPFETERNKDKRGIKIFKTLDNATDKFRDLIHVAINKTKNITHNLLPPKIIIEAINRTRPANLSDCEFGRCSRCAHKELHNSTTDLTECAHDELGRCLHKELRKVTFASSANITNKLATVVPNKTQPGFNSTVTIYKSTVEDLPTSISPDKKKRHYFLSISGGADRRAAASSFQSDQLLTNLDNSKQLRYRRADLQPESSSHKNLDYYDDKDAFQIADSLLNKVQREVEEIESRNDMLLRGDVLEFVTPRDFSNYNLEMEHHHQHSSRISKAYMFTVIFSTFIVFGAVVVALCYCIKARRCCSCAFLKEPTVDHKTVHRASSAVATAT